MVWSNPFELEQLILMERSIVLDRRATSPEEKDLKRSDAHPDQSKGRRPSKKSKDHDEDGRRIDYG